MYCNIVIPVEDSGVMVMVTEVAYTPRQRRTFHCEGLPENIEILGGYAVDVNGDDVDFDDVLESNLDKISDVCLEWYKSD